MVNLRSQDFKDIELAEKETGMYLACCVSEKERDYLRDKWNEAGGYHVIPWYKWVLQNVSVSVDYKEGSLDEQNPE